MYSEGGRSTSMSDRRLVRGRVNIHLATMCLLTRFYHTHTPVAFEGKEQVFEAKVKDSSYVYQAGANLVFIRVAQGSAAVTVDGERRARAHHHFHHSFHLQPCLSPQMSSCWQLARTVASWSPSSTAILSLQNIK